ncbi:MAG: chemotaxis protein [Aminobacteriaceae bacterium]
MDVQNNEWQVVVFFLGEQEFAISVDKTREILRWPGSRPIPDSHPAMIGITSVRGEVMPLVDLRSYFRIAPKVPLESSKVIIAEFNESKLGFAVDAVERIYGIDPSELDSTLTNAVLGNSILYVIKRKDANVLIPDYEAIIQAAAPAFDMTLSVDVNKVAELAAPLGDLTRFRILVAEDSPLIRTQICDVLNRGGFTGITQVADGKEAWDRLAIKSERYDLLITDVEMPRLDGITLVKQAREHPDLERMPIIIYSSIMAQDVRVKISGAGADAHVTKPELPRMVEKVCRLLVDSKQKQVAVK